MSIISTNPANNYEVIGEFDELQKSEIPEVLKKSTQAQVKWAGLSLKERCQHIHSLCEVITKYKAELATIISKEIGKPYEDSLESVDHAVYYFNEYIKQSEEALSSEVVFENDELFHEQRFEPLGVILTITPWNFPIYNLPFQAGQPLIAGNSVVYKPSEEMPAFTTLLKQIVAESTLPDDVLTVVVGGREIGQALVEQDFDAILFTGSTATGQVISESVVKKGIPVFKELGGSAPGIVFEDADVEKSVKAIGAFRFNNTGQYCDALKRLIVHKSVYKAIVDGLKKYIADTKVGDPFESGTAIGSLVSKPQLDKLVAQVEDAKGKGAVVIVGGEQPADVKGAFFELTLLSNITFDMRVWKEEVFGPVLPIVTFETEAEAIELANDTEYGLGGFIFTEDLNKFNRVASKIEAGNIALNDSNYFSPYTPFGGYKQSGNSRSQGKIGFHEVTQVKVVSIPKSVV